MTAAQSSSTASLIAKGLVFLSRDPQFSVLVPPPAAEASAWFVPSGRLLRLMDRPWFRWAVRATERVALPGILPHYALRKQYLERVVRNGLQDGFRQVVVLGAGFDTLALRLHLEFPQVRFLEVDHPATQRDKRHALEMRGLPQPNLRFLAADFTQQTLEAALAACAEFDPTADTLFLAEGVLMYLQQGEVELVFLTMGRHAGRRVRLAFTFLEPGGFAGMSPLVRLWLWLRHEQFRWVVRGRDLPEYLESRGLCVVELAPAEAFGSRARGESICLAERRS
jgi:methyltransferase (TIGR00027 family)